MTRSQRAASAAVQWVTSANVAPRRAGKSNIRPTIALPVASSRLPVGSSAISNEGRGQSAAGERDALLLASGKLGGIVTETVAEAHLFELGPRARGRVVHAGKLQAGGDIFERGHGRDEVKRLEHDANSLSAEPGQSIFVHRTELDAVDLNFASVRPLKPGHDHQQR